MDGVDLACCDFSKEMKGWSYTMLATVTLPYPAGLREKLEIASTWDSENIRELDTELGKYYGELLNKFHYSHGLTPELIASHGHTVLHDPDHGVTLQAGHGGIISEETGIRVVNDFRREDVAQGGQGAPLVPVGDRLLFGKYESCLNLGGIANISYDDVNDRRIAYDLCPANMALNWIAALNGLEFDEGGKLAKMGQVDLHLLEVLNNLEYYLSKPPKSLGREWFLNIFLPIIKTEARSVSNLMATVVEHIAIQITSEINKSNISSVLVTGGGAFNHWLMKRINHHSSANFKIPDKKLIQFKEALVFAFLGLLRTQNEINCLSSVTGGKRDLSAGTIHTIINQ